jgi:hypothetical protein
LCAVFGGIFFLPALRFARCYNDLLTVQAASVTNVTKLLLRLNFFLPLLVSLAWVNPLSRSFLVEQHLVKCRESDLWRDCVDPSLAFADAAGDESESGTTSSSASMASEILPAGMGSSSTGFALLNESQWCRLRFMLLVVTVVLRMWLVRVHLQCYLDAGRHSVMAHLRRTGSFTQAGVKSRLSNQYSYLVITALQYFAPMLILFFCVVLMKRKSGYNLGVCDAYEQTLDHFGIENTLKQNSSAITITLDRFSPEVAEKFGAAVRKLKVYSQHTVASPQVLFIDCAIHRLCY